MTRDAPESVYCSDWATAYHLDTPNGRFGQYPDARAGWGTLGIAQPGRFRRVQMCVRRHPSSAVGSSRTATSN